jgi:hypothetical protein
MFSQIGSQPMSKAFISAAASTRESSGLMQRGVGVVMSFIFMFIILSEGW